MEKPFTNYIFIDLRERDYKGPNYWFVSPRGASHDAGTDVSRTSSGRSMNRWKELYTGDGDRDAIMIVACVDGCQKCFVLMLLVKVRKMR